MPGQTFSSFINSSIASDYAANFAKAEKIGVSSLNAISIAAQRANNSLNLIGSNRGLGSAGSGNPLRQQAQALDTVTAASSRNAVQLRAQGAAARVAANDNSLLQRSLQTTATTLAVVQGPLGPLAGRLTSISRALGSLTGFQTGLAGAGVALFAVARLGSQYANTTSRLRTVTNSQEEFNAALQTTTAIAIRARTSLDPVVDLFIKLKNTAPDFGISAERINRLVETASKAATLSGGSRESQQAGLLQFSQALGSNRLGGDEFRSVMENLPVLAKAIAQGLDVPIGKLKQLSQQGVLTTDVIFKALERSAARVDAQFAKLPITLTSAVQTFSTQFQTIIGGIDSAVGLTSALAAGLLGVANNLHGILSVATAIGVAFTAMKAASIGSGIVTAVGSRADSIIQAKQAAAQASAIRGAITAQQAQYGLVTDSAERLALIERANALSRAQYSKEAVAETRSIVVATETEIAALKTEIAQREANIILMREEKTAAEGLILSAAYPTVRAGSGELEGARAAQATATRALAEEEALLMTASTGLAVAEDRLAIQTTALAVAETEASITTKALTASTLASTGVMARLSAVGSSLLSFFNPYVLAITAATTALIYLATKTSEADEVTARYAGTQSTLLDRLQKTSSAMRDQVAALQLLEAAKTRNDAEDKQREARVIQQRLSGRIGAAIGIAAARNPDAVAELQALRRSVDAGDVINNIGKLQELQKKYADVFRDTTIFGLGKSTSADQKAITEDVDTYVKAVDLAAQARQKLKTLGVEQGPILGNKTMVTQQTLLDRAAVDAIDGGTTALRAAAGRRKQVALDQLNADFTKRYGANFKLADGSPEAQEYETRATKIIATYQRETDAFKASTKAKGQAERDYVADLKKSDAEAAQRALAAAETKKTDSLTQLEERAPGLSRQQYLDARIAILQTYDAEKNDIKEVDELSDAAGKQRLSDARATSAAVLNLRNEDDRRLVILQLQAQGRNEEAAALGRILPLVDRIGDAGFKEYDNAVLRYRQEQQINDLLSSRQRIVGVIQGAVDSTRQAFTQLLLDGPKGAGNFIKSLINQAKLITATKITETIFAGADAKVRALTDSSSVIQSTTDVFASGMSIAAGAANDNATAVNTATAAVNDFASALQGAAAGGFGAGGTPATVDDDLITVTARKFSGTLLDELKTDIPHLLRTLTGGATNAINPLKGLPGGTAVTGTIVSTAIGNIGKMLGITVPKSIEKGIGTLLQGAAIGGTAASILEGKKANQTGAAIGGAIGKVAGNAIDKAIGGPLGKIAKIALPIIGGILGGLFGQKVPTGKSTVSYNVNYRDVTAGKATGNDAAAKAAATGAAKSVVTGVDQIADALGATIQDFGTITIGTRGGKYRVNVGGTSLKKSKGAVDFGKNGGDEAVAYAIEQAIDHGVIKGISQASINILKSGQDLTRALQKALTIENIPKQLLAIVDPVKSAVTVLNDQFTKTIAILEEAGATAEQFAQAQQLYDLERAQAIKDAKAQANSAITDLITQLTQTDQSPLNRRTVYQNAQTAYAKLAADVRAGKAVDANDLATAASNYEQASQALYGSSQAFFNDFNDVLNVLNKAKDINTGTPDSLLPGSPFDDATVQEWLSGQQQQLAATNTQTQQITGLLAQIYAALGGSSNDNSAIGQLAGFA